MSAASNMEGESIDILLRHEDMPITVALGREILRKKNEIFLKHGGLTWKSKQRLHASPVTKEAVILAVESLEPSGGGRNIRSLQDVATHPTVRRGDYPIADESLDYIRKYFEVEMSDMIAFLSASAAAASVGVIPEAAANGMASSSRKRSYSRVAKDDTANKSLKGSKGESVATHQSLRALPASVEGGRSSDRKTSVATGSSKGPDKWQTDKMMDWMKKNNYNPSRGVYTIDELVESTKMKPSQIVTWINANVAKLHKQPEIIVIDDDDEESVPELAEDDDAWTGLEAEDVLGPSTAMPHKVPRAVFEIKDEAYLDSMFLELVLDLAGLDDSSGSFRSGQSSGEKSSAPCVSLTDCEESELFNYLSCSLGTENEYKDKGKPQRRSERIRTDSLDSLFALLD